MFRSELPERVTMTRNSPLILRCRVTGIPTPDITWRQNDVSLEPCAQFQQHFDGKTVTLLVSQITESAEYLCVAKNSFGVASRRCFIQVA